MFSPIGIRAVQNQLFQYRNLPHGADCGSLQVLREVPVERVVVKTEAAKVPDASPSCILWRFRSLFGSQLSRYPGNFKNQYLYSE
jgi:hypothetical protein